MTASITHAAVDHGLPTCGTLLDLQLRPARSDGFGHSTHLLHLIHNTFRLVVHFVRQRFHHIRPGPRVNNLKISQIF